MNPRDEHNSPFRHREPILFKSWRKFWGIFLNKCLTFFYSPCNKYINVFLKVSWILRSSEFCEEKNQSEEEIYLTSTFKETVVIWSTRGRAYWKGENWSSSLWQLAYFFFRTLDHFPQLQKPILRWHCWRSVSNIAFLFFWCLSICGSSFPPDFCSLKKARKEAQQKVTYLEGNPKKSEKAHLRLYYQR